MKRHLIIILLILITSSAISGQTDFFKTYNLGESNHSTFYDMIIENDTITAIGVQYSSEGQIGILWCKMDTLGNILNLKTHFDSSGDDLYITSAHQVTKTSDGGYLIPGQYFYKSNPFLLKLNQNGEKEFLQEYEIFEGVGSRYRKIIETPLYYVSIGKTFINNSNYFKAFVMFADKQGTMMDIKYYQTPSLSTGFAKIEFEDDKLYLYGSAGNFVNVSFENAITKYLLVCLDHQGNELSYNLFPAVSLSNYISNPFNFIFDNDSNYITAGIEWSLDDLNEVSTSPVVIARDQDLNIIWKTNLGGFTFHLNRLTDIILTQDNTYVVNGDYLQVDENDTPIYRGSLLAKVAQDGTEIWTRTDSIPDHDPKRTISYMTKTVELSSGSLMSCGYYIDNELGEVAATLFKFDKNGCMNGDCENVVLSIGDIKGHEIIIGPNPFHEHLQLKADYDFEYKLYSNNGHLLQESTAKNDQYYLDMNKYLSGVYFIQLQIEDAIHVRKIIKQ